MERKESQLPLVPFLGIMKFPIPNGVRFENVENIEYCEAIENYTRVHLQDGKQFMLCKTLGYVHKILNTPVFVRTHKSYLINLFFMKEIKSKKNESVILTSTGASIPLARRRKKQIIDAINTFNKSISRF